MHVAPQTRERAFRILSELLNPSGLLVITFRQGTDAAEKAEQGFHDVSADELIGYANRRAIARRGRSTRPDLMGRDLEWETLVFAMPDDGIGSLPLLRHVIVNDNKSSTYKLGLLRTLVRIAETAPGLVIERTDDYVDIPFGAVGLYWLKQFVSLVLHHGLPQRPPGPGGYGWAKRDFYRLGGISPSDLRLGARFDADRARIVTRRLFTHPKVLTNMVGLPREHRHALYPGTNLRCSVQQLRDDVATIQHPVQELPLVRREIEQESESFTTTCNRLFDPRFDPSRISKMVMRQADSQFLLQLKLVALDRLQGSSAPVASSTGPYGQHSHLDRLPVEIVNGQDSAGVEQIARRLAVEERDQLAGNNFVEI